MSRSRVRFETWRVEGLLPYAQNARTHSDEQILEIAQSISEYGVTNPPLVTPEGELIAGHWRFNTWTGKETPVLIIEGPSAGQIKFLRLADNRIALNAGWDEDLLATELQWLVDEGFNVLEAGFSDDELAEVINFSSSGEAEPELGDEDAVPEVPIEPEAKTNEIWKLGPVFKQTLGPRTGAM